MGGAGVISPPPWAWWGGGSVILVPPLVKILCTFLYIALIRFSSNILSAPTNFCYFVPVKLDTLITWKFLGSKRGGQQSLAPPSNLSYNLQSLSSKLPSIEELLIFEKIIKCNNIKGMLWEKVGKSSRGGSSPPWEGLVPPFRGGMASHLSPLWVLLLMPKPALVSDGKK